MSVALNRAVRYGIENYLRAVGVLLLVLLLIPLALWIMMTAMGGNGSNFNGYSLSVGIFGLVLGDGGHPGKSADAGIKTASPAALLFWRS